jgi:ribosomal protein L40E
MSENNIQNVKTGMEHTAHSYICMKCYYRSTYLETRIKLCLYPREADKLTAICEPIFFKKCRSLDISQPYGPRRPVTGIALHFFTL